MIAKVRHIVDKKRLMANLPTERYVDPKYVYIATNNARCVPYRFANETL